MPEKVMLYEIPPSPNNVKVRIALNYKEIPFERVAIPIDPDVPIAKQDRSMVIEISRQPLTPTLVHGSTVVFDSAAILRHLEANFPRSRPIFSTDYATMKTIEEWEVMGRYRASQPVAAIFGLAMAGKSDRAEIDRANTILHDVTGKVEEQLVKGPWLVAGDMTAADLTIAPYLSLGMVPAEAAGQMPVLKFFHDNLKIGEGKERTRDWVRRVMAYDR